eukprot:scaffold2676_cov295-Prasinococcus_capsulatus_cf.AAC.1
MMMMTTMIVPLSSAAGAPASVGGGNACVDSSWRPFPPPRTQRGGGSHCVRAGKRRERRARE